MAANLEINVVSKDELSAEEIISMIRKKIFGPEWTQKVIEERTLFERTQIDH
ncbi:MAG: hypothetical protein Q4A75_09850 [Peptostreptococcaceae bacterium]|nr:hypothetical protein [Peptostreptococcaceae bacterium]